MAKNPSDGGENARGSETSRRHLAKPNVMPAQGRRSDSDRVLARQDQRPLWAGRTYPLFLAMEPHQPRTSLTTTRARSCKRKGGGSPRDRRLCRHQRGHFHRWERYFKAFCRENRLS